MTDDQNATTPFFAQLGPLEGEAMLVNYVPPRRYADDGSHLSCTIGVIRPGHAYKAGSVQHDSLEQVVAVRRMCRFCDVPVSHDTIGCVILATPLERGADVNAVNIAVCRDCDSRDDFTLIETLANDLAKNPQLRAKVYVVPEAEPPTGNRQARRLAARAARKVTP
jgi:hypothetical protein